MKRMNRRMQASTSRLEPGQDTIDRSVTRTHNGAIWLDWTLRMPDGRIIRKRTKGPTVGTARKRAHAKAEELLTVGEHAEWKPNSNITDYIQQVSFSAIDRAALEPSSRNRYKTVIRYLYGDCKNPHKDKDGREHRHEHSLDGMPIVTATEFRRMEECLQEIASLHGAPTAKQVRKVLNKYVLGQLLRDNLIASNPLSRVTIDLSDDKAPTGRGGVALELDEYMRVLNHLLAMDPSTGIEKPRRGRWKLEDAIARRRNVIDLTLLQMSTGLRISEANQLTWDSISVKQGVVWIPISETMSKTHRSRLIPILHASVAERIMSRKQNRSDTDYVIGSPADPSREWERQNSIHAVADLYEELAADLHIDKLKVLRSHVWRATLNTIMADNGISVEQRAAFLGHTPAINENSYTDSVDITNAITTISKALGNK